MNKIYLTEYNKNCDRHLIIDGDEHSVWVYVMKNSNSGKGIDFNGFLCSRGTILKSSEQVKKYIDKSFQPPLTERYMNEFSIQN